jgi:hypothetical protein
MRWLVTRSSSRPAATGLVYYASFKLTNDQFDNFPNVLVRGKNKVFALGPEATLAIASKGTLYGFVK